MSSQDTICIRFPNGTMEFAFPEALPEVGDKLSRGRDEREVVAVAEDATGRVVVTLGPPWRQNRRRIGGSASERNPPTLNALQNKTKPSMQSL